MSTEQTDDRVGLPISDEEVARSDWRARVEDRQARIEERLDEGAVRMEALHDAVESANRAIGETKAAVEQAHDCLDGARAEIAELRADVAGFIEWSQRMRLTRRATAAAAHFLGQCVKGGALSLSGIAKVVTPIVTLALLAYGAWSAFKTGAVPPGLLGH